MILSFHFEYISKNSVLENFLTNSLIGVNLKYTLVKEPDMIKLFVEGEDEVLMEFSNTLSTTLPISIYFKSLHVEAVDELPESNFQPKKCEIVLPFTPIMSNESNPFTTPDVGKAVVATPILYFKSDSSEEIGFEPIFQKCAKELASGAVVHVKTFGGSFNCVALKNSKISLQKNAIVVATDLSTVQKMVIAQESEIKALASLEKPILNLPTNAIFDSKELCDKKFVDIALSNDMISHLLCVELFKLGVEYVVFESVEPNSLNKDNSLWYEGESPIERIKVSVLEKGEILTNWGKYFVSDELKNLNLKNETKKHMHFITCLKENTLFDKKVAGFYLSKSNEDGVMVYDDGMLDLLGIEFAKNGSEIFKQIQESQTGAKLLENYKNAYPKEYEMAQNLSFENRANNIATMIGFSGVLLGYAQNIEDGLEAILNNATLFSGLKGPRVDFILNGDKITSGVNPYRIIRSGLSYRLAGVDELTLSFGYVDSLAHFISDLLDRLKSELDVECVTLCGSMFEHKKFSNLAFARARASLKVAYNKELPIDN